MILQSKIIEFGKVFLKSLWNVVKLFYWALSTYCLLIVLMFVFLYIATDEFDEMRQLQMRSMSEYAKVRSFFNKFKTDGGKLEYMKAYFTQSIAIADSRAEYFGIVNSYRGSKYSTLVGCIVTGGINNKNFLLFWGIATMQNMDIIAGVYHVDHDLSGVKNLGGVKMINDSGKGIYYLASELVMSQ